ncbi:MAG: EAL domain-containing protein [Myxococcota bacterium]
MTARPPPGTPADAYGRGLSLLLVDGDEADLLALRAALERCAFSVVTASTCAEALTQVRLQTFDFALLDRILPDGRGLDIAHHLQTSIGHTDVLLMSAHADVSSAVASAQCGVGDYFVKPIDLDDLHARMRRLVLQRNLRHDNSRLLADLREKNAELSALVVHDPLTRLYTHVHFHEMLQREITRCRRHQRSFCVLLVNIDNFSQLNNAHGHATGDALVEALGALLRTDRVVAQTAFKLRQHDIAARYGPDTFAVILADTSKAGGTALAERLRAHVESTFATWGPVGGLTVSIGAAAFNEDAEDRYQLLHATITALAAAKALGKNRVIAFSPELATTSNERERFAALDRVLAEERVTFHLQPLVNVVTGKIFAYEALCRPLDPAFASPLELVKVAGRAGKIWDLGRLLRRHAIAALDRIPEDVLLFVNLHPQEIYDPQLPAEAALLGERARRLVFEMTEAAEITDQDNTRLVLDRLRSYGLRMAIDDLGAGYSGLGTLLSLTPDFVKLDMGLIRGIESISRPARLIRHIVAFTRDEGMTLVAEGVETAAELKVVTELGIPLVQGFFFARPAPLDEVLARTGTLA